VRHALYLAPFGEFADPRAVVELAIAAEKSGWDGLFLWDHIWRPPDRSPLVGDAWITLAAVAARTERIRIGPMIVPLARRRPQKVARESVALDHLTSGRLTLGVGLGVDTGGELQRFGEISDPRARGIVLDEALDVLVGLWSGDVVRHTGPHFTVDDVQFQPTPVQQPRIPIWVAAEGKSGPLPLRRASRFDGIFPVGTTKEQLKRMLEVIEETRGNLDGFDVAVMASGEFESGDLAHLGVTWTLRALAPNESFSRALEIASAPPN
jgi:alkanesulfonate monooxygenase SsuD/methylene tetrahydromethanopterin reductase-like flavin-dependent oxidoreductase (luciferase family)